ncbi:MAG: hypothetical protein QOJ54_108, partial [Aliidongia sp.]|nr:hypothetical protein [Aliidongia sp.]
LAGLQSGERQLTEASIGTETVAVKSAIAQLLMVDRSVLCAE